MNAFPNKPSDSDREYLQAELTRLVGQGRLDLNSYQDLVDVVWATDDNADLMRIRARYLGGPPAPGPPAPQGHHGQPTYAPAPQNHPQHPAHRPPVQPPMPQPPAAPQQYNHYGAPTGGGIPMGGHLPGPPDPGTRPEPEISNMGSIKKTGQWIVPAYSAYKLRGADLHLDLRKATASAPVVTFDVDMNMSSMILIVPPGVHVDVQMTSKNWSEFKVDTSAPLPGAPRVVLSGMSRASTLKVFTKNPDEPIGFWGQILGN